MRLSVSLMVSVSFLVLCGAIERAVTGALRKRLAKAGRRAERTEA